MILKDIVFYFDELLDVSNIEDKYCLNGLQIGLDINKIVNNVCFAVDSNLDVLKKAVKKNCDLLVVHHGFFWGSGKNKIYGQDYEFLKILLSNNINLYNVHIPLDSNLEIGNNVELAKILNAKFSITKLGVGYLVELEKNLLLDVIIKRYETYFNSNLKKFEYGSSDIKKIFICSGGGTGEFSKNLLNYKLNFNVDLLITGDMSYADYDLIKNSKTNCLVLGHYLSETVGIKALQKKFEEKFGIKSNYIDVYKEI